jgi:hypothetical protein
MVEATEDARDAPGGVLTDLALVPAETRPSLTPASALSPPERPESTSAPSDHGFGLDDHQRTPPALPDAVEKNPDHAVLVLQRRSLSTAAKDLELVTEGDVLEDQCLAKAK